MAQLLAERNGRQAGVYEDLAVLSDAIASMLDRHGASTVGDVAEQVMQDERYALDLGDLDDDKARTAPPALLRTRPQVVAHHGSKLQIHQMLALTGDREHTRTHRVGRRAPPRRRRPQARAPAGSARPAADAHRRQSTSAQRTMRQSITSSREPATSV